MFGLSFYYSFLRKENFQSDGVDHSEMKARHLEEIQSLKSIFFKFAH